MANVSMHLFKKKLPTLNSALDAYSLREKVIAKNIANAGTPGYRPEVVKFEEEFSRMKMEQSGSRTDSRHIPIGSSGSKGMVHPQIEEKQLSGAEKFASGMSGVNLDKEMAELAQNQIRFRFASQMTSKYFRGLQTAIRGVNS